MSVKPLMASSTGMKLEKHLRAVPLIIPTFLKLAVNRKRFSTPVNCLKPLAIFSSRDLFYLSRVGPPFLIVQ